MIRRPPRSTRTDTLFPYTTLFRSYHQVQRDRVRGFDEVGDAPVRSGGYRSNRGIAVQPEEGHGSRAHARALVLALVEELARCRGHHGMDDGRVDRKSTRLNSSH